MKDDNLEQNSFQQLAERIHTGPCILFLGQTYSSVDMGTDAFLSEILRKYVNSENQNYTSYDSILQEISDAEKENRLAWIHNLCNRLSVPNNIKTISKFAWNSVITSAIDAIWYPTFIAPYRDLHFVLNETENPYDPRNKKNLHCTFLYGCVSQASKEGRPPLTPIDKIMRKQTAIGLSRRLPETLTPLGTLFIEGYDWHSDWFQVEDFFPIVNSLAENQVHIFSVKDSEIPPLVKHLVKLNRVVLHTSSLAEFLVSAEKSGLLSLGEPPELIPEGRSIFIAGKPISIPPEIWQRVSRSARLIDVNTTCQPPKISEEMRYSEFRKFISGTTTTPQWEGYLRGFAFRRVFENSLYNLVTTEANCQQYCVDPILLYGPTATGKTIAMGGLSLQIAKEKSYPLLFIERRYFRPLYSDIDFFCTWAENAGASCVIILWDGMQEYSQYQQLLHYLSSRGRKKVVLVGTCYPDQCPKTTKNKGRFIEAPSLLNDNEKANFEVYIKSIDSVLSEFLKQKVRVVDRSFLATLYRLLPDTRNFLRKGVHAEIAVAEEHLQNLSKTFSNSTNDFGTLGSALIKAGIAPKDPVLSSNLHNIAGENHSDIQMIVDIVMVPGRFGLNIPIELLFRAIDKPFSNSLITLLRLTDVFRWSEDAFGNIYIGPRQPLEALLISQSRFGSAAAELSIVSRIIKCVNDKNTIAENPEIDFVIELLRSVGPNNEYSAYYGQHLPLVLDALKYLRQNRSINNPRMMLQEANLLREYTTKFTNKLPHQVVKLALDEADEILNLGLRFIADNRFTGALQSMFLVEKAAVIAARVKSHNTSAVELFEYKDQINEIFNQAWAVNPSNIYIVDVLAWSSIALLKRDELNSPTKADIAASASFALDIAEEQGISDICSEQLLYRKMELGQAMEDRFITDAAFAELLKAGSTAGYYLRAKHLANSALLKTENIADIIDNAKLAFDFLEKHYKEISSDHRCLYLHFQLWWLLESGHRIFDEERVRVPFTVEKWARCIELIDTMFRIESLHNNATLMFLHAIANFHLMKYPDAFAAFRELEQIAIDIGRRRILKSYILSGPKGEPVKCTGQVKKLDIRTGRGSVYVEKLRREIAFFARDFNEPEIKVGASLPKFHIAFNFIGPIADPHHFLERR